MPLKLLMTQKLRITLTC